MAGKGTAPGAPGAAAEAFDAVRWDFDPEELDLTPLAPAGRYFAEFPWDGEEAGAPRSEHPLPGAEGPA